MIDVGIGLLFAFLFVTADLVVSKLLRTGERGPSRWREIVNQPFGNSKAINAKPAKLFLTTGEMSDHHSGAKRAQTGGK